VEVTVNLKDLRGVVQLCESSDVDVAIYCAQAGAPVVVKPTADFKMFHHRDALGNQPQYAAAPASVDFEAELVLASMLPPEDAEAMEPSQSQRCDDAPAPLQNAPLGSQPWSAVPDSENASQRDGGDGGVDAPSRPWAPGGAATTTVNVNDDFAQDDEFVEATPPEKRRRQ
jgi:cell cycle checkpoint control protein RAD9A